MPLYMDRHDIHEATLEDVTKAHNSEKSGHRNEKEKVFISH